MWVGLQADNLTHYCELKEDASHRPPGTEDDSDEYLGDAPHVPEQTDEALSEAGAATKSPSHS
jgi:hypothetical protein